MNREAQLFGSKVESGYETHFSGQVVDGKGKRLGCATYRRKVTRAVEPIVDREAKKRSTKRQVSSEQA